MCSTDDFLWFANYMSQKPLGRFDGESLSFLSSTQLGTTTPIYIAESSKMSCGLKIVQQSVWSHSF